MQRFKAVKKTGRTTSAHPPTPKTRPRTSSSGRRPLTPGDFITFSGTVLAMNSSVADAVVGETSARGLGGLILSGLGGVPTPASTTADPGIIESEGVTVRTGRSVAKRMVMLGVGIIAAVTGLIL